MQVCGPFKRLEKHFTHWNPWLDYAVCVVYQEPRGEKTAIENLQNLKTVFSEKGADGVGEQLDAMDREAVRRLTSAAGLPLRAGGKMLVASELRSALQDYVTVTLCADGEEQAGNLHRSDRDQLCKEHVVWNFESLQLDMRACCRFLSSST